MSRERDHPYVWAVSYIDAGAFRRMDVLERPRLVEQIPVDTRRCNAADWALRGVRPLRGELD